MYKNHLFVLIEMPLSPLSDYTYGKITNPKPPHLKPHLTKTIIETPNHLKTPCPTISELKELWPWPSQRETMKIKRTYHFLSFTRVIFQAWKLWNDDNNIALVDTTIRDPCFRMEMLRCINVGLLCVQESARDRPTVSTVISMLNGEIVDLPSPKQPAFTETQNIAPNIDPTQQGQIRFSIYNVTITTVLGQ